MAQFWQFRLYSLQVAASFSGTGIASRPFFHAGALAKKGFASAILGGLNQPSRGHPRAPVAGVAESLTGAGTSPLSSRTRWPF